MVKSIRFKRDEMFGLSLVCKSCFFYRLLRLYYSYSILWYNPRMPKKTTPKPARPKPGPKPDTLVIEDDWEQAMKKSLAKKKPASGWPK